MNYTGKGVSEAIDSFYKYWTIDEAEKIIKYCTYFGLFGYICTKIDKI